MAPFLSFFLTALTAILHFSYAIPLDVSSPDSIKNASSTLAYGLMLWYSNNQTNTIATAVGTFPQPLYWWEAGAIWGGMIIYRTATGDTSYDQTITEGLLAQVGPGNNFMPPAYYASLGNDDQAFWAIASLNAAEYGFPIPTRDASTMWVDLAEAVFNTMVPRWFTAECNGGLQWQVFQSNPGWGYKNSISNGGFFQIAARLAVLTGNQTYIDWSEKIWNWMANVGFIDQDYNVFDGAGSAANCTQIDHIIWTYNPSMLLYGAAVLSNYTGSDLWAQRTSGLLMACANSFFSPYPNATNIMYERACEPGDNCNNDQYSFKAYLARWMAQAAVVVPDIKETVITLLAASAQAAAQACSGDTNGTVCGQKWYVGGYDGSFGVGQQLSALETVQALLLLQSNTSAPIAAPMQKPAISTATLAPSPVQQVITLTTTKTRCPPSEATPAVLI